MGRMKEIFIEELERELMINGDVYLDNAWHYAKWTEENVNQNKDE